MICFVVCVLFCIYAKWMPLWQEKNDILIIWLSKYLNIILNSMIYLHKHTQVRSHINTDNKHTTFEISYFERESMLYCIRITVFAHDTNANICREYWTIQKCSCLRVLKICSWLLLNKTICQKSKCIQILGLKEIYFVLKFKVTE